VIIANNSNILIHTVGFGDRYNLPLLEAIASNTYFNISNGEFFNASESNALVMFFAGLEGWQKQQIYSDSVVENETVEICRYYIDERYPYIRIWLFWDDLEECDLEIIVKDHNGDNITSINNGGQYPPSYSVYNCTGIDYIDVFIYGKIINNSLEITWVCSLESISNYNSPISEGKEKPLFYNKLFFNEFFIIIYISIIFLAICIVSLLEEIYTSKKLK
ncbi:unnamed protein product, partial [marine sediment metagenome]